MINDFLEEAKKLAKGEELTPARKEIQEFVRDIYHDLKKGRTQKWIWTASAMFIKSINSEISKEELIKGVTVIDGMIRTVLSDFISEGILTKMEVKR